MASTSEQELHFIIERMVAEREHRRPRCWGRSSDALAIWSIKGGPEPSESDYPSDPSDLMACLLTYQMAPERLQRRMAPVLERFQRHVERRYPEARARIDAYLAGDRSEWATGKPGITGIRLTVP